MNHPTSKKQNSKKKIKQPENRETKQVDENHDTPRIVEDIKMFRKMVLNSIFALVLILFVFCSHATATSTVVFYTEANCSTLTLVFAGVTHPSKIRCSYGAGFSGVSAGTYSWSVTGCGWTWRGTQTVNGTSTYRTYLCPSAAGSCCPTGYGKCSVCGGATTTTTTSGSTTTTTTSATTTTTLPAPTSTSALFVKNASGTDVFGVSANGAITANGASSWGSAPFVLGQDVGNRGIIVTDKAASNPKNIYFGWNPGTTHEYAEIFALQENVAYKNLILNPNGGYVGIGTKSPSYPLQMGSGAYVSTGGVWTNASSREYKKDIKELSTQRAMDALTKLNPVEFAYKADATERHVGFIAEDVPEIVASKDRKGMSAMDVVGVLTKVVQEQQKLIREQKEIVQKQQREIGILSKTVAGLESSLQSRRDRLTEARD